MFDITNMLGPTNFFFRRNLIYWSNNVLNTISQADLDTGGGRTDITQDANVETVGKNLAKFLAAEN